MRVTVAGVTDISDRLARQLGGVHPITSGGTGMPSFDPSAGDAVSASRFTWPVAGVPYLFNGTTLDRLRNIQAGGVKYALGEADPRFIGLYAGNLFTVNDYQRAPAAATNRVLYRLNNPAASGERVWVTTISVVCNVARRWGYTLLTPAQANLATGLTEVSKQAGGPAVTVVATVNAAAAADLTTFYHSELLQANVPRDYFEPIQLPDSSTLDIQVGDAGDAVTDRMTLNVEWVEETT